MQGYSIIIPVLNEAKNIQNLVQKISKFLSKFKYEIIIIDDHSNDGSKEILLKIKKSKKNFSFFVRKNKKKDLSQSVIYGISKSKFDNIIVMDGDLQHDPKYLPKLIKRFRTKKLNLVIAVRNFKKRRGLSKIRFFTSKLLIFLINVFFEKRTSDPMSGFFLIKKSIFNDCKKKLYGKGFKILFDIISSYKIKKILDYQIKFKTRTNSTSKMSYKIIYHLLIMLLSKIKLPNRINIF